MKAGRKSLLFRGGLPRTFRHVVYAKQDPESLSGRCDDEIIVPERRCRMWAMYAIAVIVLSAPAKLQSRRG